MNKTLKEIADWLSYSTVEMAAGLCSREQAVAGFKVRFSKENLKECLTDTSLDVKDIEAIKEMIGFFFGKEEVFSN